MIREKEKYISSGLILLDYLSIFVGSLVFAHLSRQTNALSERAPLSCDPIAIFIPFLDSCFHHQGLLLLTLLMPVVGLKFSDSYRLTKISHFKDVLKETLKPVLIMAAILGLAAYNNGTSFIRMAPLAGFLGIIWGLFIFCRLVVVAHLKGSKGDEQSWTCVLILGTDYRAFEAAHVFATHPAWRIRIVGFLSENEADVGTVRAGYPVLGRVDDIVDVLKRQVVDCVYWAGAAMDTGRLQHLGLLCEIVGVDFVLGLQLIKETGDLFLDKLDQLSLLVFKSAYHSPEKLFVKRAMDIVISGMAILLLLPLWLIIPLVIRWDSPGPVFFSQVRVGKNGRLYRLYKFRSMVKNAEALQGSLQNLNEMDGPVFKMKHDPRITRVGGFLRKTSLDELPQLFNVLKGDMSLVGPRPPLPEEVSHYGNAQRKRLSIKPGITCLWQISGRSEIKFNEWMRLDLQYIDHWSLALDLKILFRTVFAVLSRRGAE